ncbi:hypothetical protein EDB81DRAFT_167094 [Dactylonectria macrodidyma]|uniref:DRBM domain-containing protein n=1 Tax=Dactylonectria macrodidyma TaxID=307937 RepID=A0A9P9FP28_9HYPO|nr:hypothetical protein EDB81DRAFT_167094 [Dactylonectria macrodidyma]
MIEPSTGQTRFRAWYQIPDIKGRFPREGFGYGNGEAAPTFSQKRKAKQFAARQAMAWLSSSSRSGASSGSHVNDDAVKEEQAENDDYDYDVGMNENYNDNHSGKGKGRDEFNDNGGYLHQPPSPQNSLGRNKIRIGDAEGQNGASIAPPGQTSRTPEMPRSGNNSNSYANEDEETESPSLFKRIEKKCKNLGIDPPKYNIKLDEAGRWYGQPSLWADGRMPGDMGVVRDILSKEQAKIEMAEQVFAWLVGEERIRKKNMKTMLNSRF